MDADTDAGSQAEIDEHGRLHAPAHAGEMETFLGLLGFHRATLDRLTRGLEDAAGLGSPAPS